MELARSSYQTVLCLLATLLMITVLVVIITVAWPTLNPGFDAWKQPDIWHTCVTALFLSWLIFVPCRVLYLIWVGVQTGVFKSVNEHSESIAANPPPESGSCATCEHTATRSAHSSSKLPQNGEFLTLLGQAAHQLRWMRVLVFCAIGVSAMSLAASLIYFVFGDSGDDADLRLWVASIMAVAVIFVVAPLFSRMRRHLVAIRVTSALSRGFDVGPVVRVSTTSRFAPLIRLFGHIPDSSELRIVELRAPSIRAAVSLARRTRIVEPEACAIPGTLRLGTLYYGAGHGERGLEAALIRFFVNLPQDMREAFSGPASETKLLSLASPADAHAKSATPTVQSTPDPQIPHVTGPSRPRRGDDAPPHVQAPPPTESVDSPQPVGLRATRFARTRRALMVATITLFLAALLLVPPQDAEILVLHSMILGLLGLLTVGFSRAAGSRRGVLLGVLHLGFWFVLHATVFSLDLSWAVVREPFLVAGTLFAVLALPVLSIGAWREAEVPERHHGDGSSVTGWLAFGQRVAGFLKLGWFTRAPVTTTGWCCLLVALWIAVGHSLQLSNLGSTVAALGFCKGVPIAFCLGMAGIGCIRRRYLAYEGFTATVIGLCGWLAISVMVGAFLLIMVTEERWIIVRILLVNIGLDVAVLLAVVKTLAWQRLRRKCSITPVDLCAAISRAIAQGRIDDAKVMIAAQKCDLNKPHFFARSPLMASVIAQHHDLVRQLVAAGADPNRKSISRFPRVSTPLAYAQKMNDTDTLELLDCQSL